MDGARAKRAHTSRAVRHVDPVFADLLHDPAKLLRRDIQAATPEVDILRVITVHVSMARFTKTAGSWTPEAYPLRDS
jgi:hypothetical protein